MGGIGNRGSIDTSASRVTRISEPGTTIVIIESIWNMGGRPIVSNRRMVIAIKWGRTIKWTQTIW
jgi:hypothetical protein